MQLSRTRRILLTSLPLAAGLSLTLGAQSTTEKAVESDINFARGLARDWAFVDMAQSILEDVPSGGLSDRMTAELELVRCDIFGIGARASTDPTRRNALFEQALDAYQAYVEDNPYADNRADAEKSLIDLASVYARSIDIALEDAVGDEAQTLRDTKLSVLEKAVQRCGSLIDDVKAIQDPTPEQTTKRYVLMLDLASLYGKMSASTADDVVFGDLAIETYSDLIFDVGEGTEIALRANAGIGDVLSGMGQDGDAREFYLGVIDKVIPIDPAEREEALEWSKLPLDIKQKRFLYVELAVPGVQRTSRGLGELQSAIDSGIYFYNLYRSEGFSLSVLGSDAMLEFASTLVDAGGFIGGDLGAGEARWFATEDEMREVVRGRRLQRSSVQFALDVAKRVVDDNPGTEVARKGGVLIGSINERPGVEIPIAQLLQAADAKRAGEEYDAALTGYHEALQRVDALEPADRVEYAAKTYYAMGLTLKRQSRNLEAAMSFREALVNWRDPEFDRMNARGYQATIKAWARENGATRDPEAEALILEAEDYVIRFDTEGSPGEIIFNRGEKLRSRDEFQDAIDEYAKIGEDDGFYELAKIQTGYCLLRLIRLSESRGVFDDYLTQRVSDPKYKPSSPIEEARRKGAVSRAKFYRAFIDNAVAKKRFKNSDGADSSGFAAVIEQLKDYATTHGDGGRLVIKAQAILVNAYAKTGDATSAATVVDEMIRDYPDNKETADAAIDLYFALDNRRDRLMQAASGSDADAIAVLTRDMANALEVANGAAPSPEYKNLRAESNLWEDLGEWAEAKRPLERIVSRYRDDPKYGERVIMSVIPDLAEAMVLLGEVAEAKDLLSPLVVGEGAPLRSRRPTIILGRAILGDITGDGSRVQQTPGAGGTDEEFRFLTKRFDTFAKSGDKWLSCEWYEAKFMSIYAYYVWGQSNDLKLATAKKVMDDVLPFLDNDLQFSMVDEYCSDEEGDAAFRARLGAGVLAARYRWLYERTR